LKKGIKDRLPKYSVRENQQLNTRSKKIKAPNKTAGLKLFHKLAYWRELIPNKNEVEVPTNPTFVNPQGLTTQERDTNVDVQKHSFDERYDIIFLLCL
tara:strand:+ start:319 stop:612 length:294 start_codon:yes stop_codon:yes gene_type:complete